jgi:hypothetical protein
LLLGLCVLIKTILEKRIKKVLKSEHSLLIIYLIFTFIFSVFFMLGCSNIIWRNVELMQMIQYPWRLLCVAILSLSIIASFILEKIKNKYIYLIILGASLGLAVFISRPQSYLHLSKYEYLEFPFTSSTNHELMPVDFDMYKNHEYKIRLADTKGVASFSEKKWKTQIHQYQVTTPESTQIIEHSAYFPGWKTFVDGKQVDIVYKNKDYPGMITYELSAGNHDIKTVFTEDTPARKIGDRISLISIAVILLFIIKSLLKRKVEYAIKY